MALTAAIRTFLMALFVAGLTWVAQAINLTDFDIEGTAALLAGAATTIAMGLVSYALNKLGSRWGWINSILSLGRSSTSATYVPRHAESIEVTVTPPGEQTTVTEQTDGVTSKVTI